MRSLSLLLVLAGPVAALAATAGDAAATADPLRSPACIRALDALQLQEAAAAPSGPASGRAHPPGPKLAAARRDAAAACLRSRDDPQAIRRPYVQPPIEVQPQQPATRPPRPLALPRASTPPPVRHIDRPRFITTCDAIGCWADDGSRLDRVGPDLRGPRGPCTLQGTLLTCP